MAENGKSAHTIEDRLVLVKQLFKWAAHKAKLIPINPIADESVPEVPPTPQPCFTPEQVEKLIEAARPHEKPLFTALAYSGLRIGELVALRWQDVILDKGQYGHLHIRLGGSNGTTKGKSSRLIPIHPKLREVFDSLPRVHERVFLRPPTSRYPEGHHPINDRLLLSVVKKLCKRCGFPGWEKFKLHTFRHAFASMCARNHVSYKYALNWMGHKSSDILDMYVTMYDDAADMAMADVFAECKRVLMPGGKLIVNFDNCNVPPDERVGQEVRHDCRRDFANIVTGDLGMIFMDEYCWAKQNAAGTRPAIGSKGLPSGHRVNNT